MDIVYTTLDSGAQANFLSESRSSLPISPHARKRRIYFAGAATSASPFLMARFSTAKLSRDGFVLCVCGLLAASSTAQVSQKASGADASSSAQRGVSLAAKGRCQEALPILKKAAPHLADKQLKYRAVMSTARCAMSLDQTEMAVEALLVLNREFPHDPDVLYSTTHFLLGTCFAGSAGIGGHGADLASGRTARGRSLRVAGKLGQGHRRVQKILDQEPKLEGIHYRIGRIFLSKSPADAEAAKAEFNEEVKIDPDNASAEFMLGEIARQAGQWDEAIGHFSRASKLDEGFQEAYLALGMSFNSDGKFSDAIPPLRSYVKMQPGDPAGHYQLATAYARTGQEARSGARDGIAAASSGKESAGLADTQVTRPGVQ